MAHGYSHYNPAGPTRGQLRPNYSESFYDWLTGDYTWGGEQYGVPYEYGGLPGDYNLTPEGLLDYYGFSNIPGQGDYEQYGGILPTYHSERENYLLNKYLLDEYDISLGQEEARKKAGESIAETGYTPLHGFEKAGADIATETAERDTIAKIMEEVAETGNIGREQAQWAFGKQLRGGREDWTEDVVDIYNKWYASVVDKDLLGDGGGGGVPELTNEQIIDLACAENPDLPVCGDQADWTDLNWDKFHECAQGLLPGIAWDGWMPSIDWDAAQDLADIPACNWQGEGVGEDGDGDYEVGSQEWIDQYQHLIDECALDIESCDPLVSNWYSETYSIVSNILNWNTEPEPGQAPTCSYYDFDGVEHFGYNASDCNWVTKNYYAITAAFGDFSRWAADIFPDLAGDELFYPDTGQECCDPVSFEFISCSEAGAVDCGSYGDVDECPPGCTMFADGKCYQLLGNNVIHC